MRGAARLLVVTLLGVLVALPALPVAAAAPSPAQVEQPTTEPTPPTSGAPSVELDPPETEQDRAERNRKIVLGVVSVLLVGIVIWGRSIRSKRKKKADGK